MPIEYQTLNDGCSGDGTGLDAALVDGTVLVWEEYDDSEGYGHHSADAVFLLPDGRYIHAECGGCSCEGSGSWEYCASEEEAMRMIPAWRRAELEVRRG